MLKHRLLMSALLIPGAIGLFVWDHQLFNNAFVLLVLVLFLSARCVWELAAMTRSVGCQPSVSLTVAASWALILMGWEPLWYMFHADGYKRGMTLGPVFLLFGAIVVLLLLKTVFRYPLADRTGEGSRSDTPVDRRHIATLGVELLAVTYIGVLLTITCQLRWIVDPAFGYFAIGALVVATKMGDVGAYTFGRLIGGPKMTPKLSPGKTWAGGVGHLVTAGLCSVAWLCWLGPRISDGWQPWSPARAAVFGVVVGFAGLVGDLAESLIKRDVGVKDAPTLLPGFGGLLDLMDSILLAGPVAYAMWSLLR
jgi:phosphatidate cytidylyltransferase